MPVPRIDTEETPVADACDRIAQERTSFKTLLAIICGMYPAWGLVDILLEPTNLALHLGVRFTVSLLAAVCYVIVRRATDVRTMRIAMTTAIFATGFTITYLIAISNPHAQTVYSIGFSLAFWGTGFVLVWPPMFTAATQIAMLAVHLLARITGFDSLALSTWIPLFLFLASSSVIAISVSVMRRRLEDRLAHAQARANANEKLQSLGRLITQLSHEINNPINIIENNVGPLREYLADIDAVLDVAKRGDGDLEARWTELDIDFIRNDMGEALGSVGAAAARIRGIHNELREFMRTDAKVPVAADLNAGVRSTVAMLRPKMAEGTVLVERYGEVPRVRFHTGQIHQVTLNLVQNAIDMVGPHGHIEVETRVETNALVLSVTDDGPGVSEQARRHLFEPFFTTKNVGKGTGLGLATCYQIVRSHGGTIALDERHGHGARFVVKLPIVG
ncbi:MAG TPA: HAMP domain-containing sensor histidine kinase [Kofleriaceae bacterium]